MAARKSCTHLTWSEAKARVGGGGSSSTASSKNKSNLKTQAASHGELLAQKIIAKQQQAAAASEQQQHGGTATLTRAQQRRQERADAKAAVALAAARELRRQEEEERAVVTPCAAAKRRMRRLVAEWHATATAETEAAAAARSSCAAAADADRAEIMAKVAECRQAQLDEILALEAIFVDSDEFQMVEACRKGDLHDLLEQLHENEDDDETILTSIVQHPNLTFTLSLTIDDNRGLLVGEGNSDLELVASVVLLVSLPPLYPLYETTPPDIVVHDVMVTSRTAAPIRSDKTLESLVHVPSGALATALRNECAQNLLPDLCVCEIATTWLSEHLFEFAALRTHAVAGVVGK